MKKVGLIIILSLFILLVSGCGNKEFVGYWCRYDETSIITVMLKDDVSNDDMEKIKDKLTEYGEATNFVYYSKEDYAKLINEDIDKIYIYATYVVSYASNDYIGTLVSELNEMNGVQEALQTSAKNNILLYNLRKDGTYTFTDTDEAKDDDYDKGTYKIKNGVITFKNDSKGTSLLYTKDKFLCVDADCNKIFAKTDENCRPLND